jgi:hypothetical protein
MMRNEDRAYSPDCPALPVHSVVACAPLCWIIGYNEISSKKTDEEEKCGTVRCKSLYDYSDLQRLVDLLNLHFLRTYPIDTASPESRI